MQVYEAVGLGFSNRPLQAGIVFLQLLEQYLEARLGFLFVFSSWITYVNLGRLFSLSALVSLQSLVCLAGKPMAGLMAVQDPPSLKDT